MRLFRPPIFQHRTVIPNPWIAQIEFRRPFQFIRRFVKFFLRDVVPGDCPASGCVVFRIVGKLLQFLQCLLAPLRNARHHIADYGPRLCVGGWSHGYADLIFAERRGQMIRLRDIGIGRFDVRLFRSIHRDSQIAQRAKMRLDCLLQRRWRQIKSLHDRLVDRDFLIQHQIEIHPRLRQLIFIDQVMDRHPRLRVVQRVMRSFPGTRAVVLHGEQIDHVEPYRRAHQLCQRLRSIGVARQIFERVFIPLGRHFRIASNIHALVVHPQGAEVFRESFVEPALRRRIVVVHQIMRQRVRNRPPRVRLKKIQHDIDSIAPRHIKPFRHILFCRSYQTEIFVALQRNHGDGQRHFQLAPHQLLSK